MHIVTKQLHNIKIGKQCVNNSGPFSQNMQHNSLFRLHYCNALLAAAAISLRLQVKLSFPYNCQKMNGQIYVLLC